MIDLCRWWRTPMHEVAYGCLRHYRSARFQHPNGSGHLSEIFWPHATTNPTFNTQCGRRAARSLRPGLPPIPVLLMCPCCPWFLQRLSRVRAGRRTTLRTLPMGLKLALAKRLVLTLNVFGSPGQWRAFIQKPAPMVGLSYTF